MSRSFKVIIAGGRDFTDLKYLIKVCNNILSKKGKAVTVVSGTAGGADRLGEAYAYSKGFHVERFPAPWDDVEGKPDYEIGITKFGKKFWKLAGHFRNEQMANFADAAIIFWDEKSKGTKNMISLCEKFKIPHVVKIYGEAAKQLKLKM